MLTTTRIIGGTAAIAVISAFWEKIKFVFHRFYSIFVVTVKFEDLAAYAFTMYLIRNFSRSKFSDIDVGGFSDYVRPEKKNLLIAIKRIPTKTSIWRKGSKFLATKRNWDSIKITYFRGVFNCNKLISDAMFYYNSRKELMEDNNECRFFVSVIQGSIGDKESWLGQLKKSGDGGEVEGSPESSSKTASEVDKFTGEIVGWNIDDIGQPVLTNAINYLSYPPYILKAYKDAHQWKKNEYWYKEHLIPWKKGWLFIGQPGTGKTSLIRALGQDLNIPVFVFDISTMTNKDFRKEWIKCRAWTPCIIAIEDIHSVFDGRKNVCHDGKMESGLTFEFLLNTVDGLENSEGVFLIMSGNDLSKIDPALGGKMGLDNDDWSRPGRIDRVINFDCLDYDGKVKMATRIFKGIPEGDWFHFIDDNISVTGAQFQFICAKAALDIYEKEK